MVTYATDNPFPSVLFEETEAVDLANNPASGQRRLIVDPSDHLLYLVDTAGTATVVGGGLTDPMTTRGDIIVRNSSNATARLAKGSAGTYLGSDGTDVAYSAVTDAKLSLSDITTNNASTSSHGFLKKLDNSATHYMDGTGAWSTPAGASAGSFVWLQRQTASTSATLDFTSFLSSTYDVYEIAITSLIPASNAVNLWMRFGTGGGPTYATADYTYGDYRFVSTPGSAAAGAGAQAQLLITNATDTVSSTATYGVNATIRLHNPLSTSVHKHARGNVEYINSSSILEGSNWVGSWAQTTALTALRFLFSSGNIASGTIDVYGLTHA